jgi:heme/copper-type cytochrome/quinol oxidase subunit 2
VWTILPAVILGTIAIPSLNILYKVEEEKRQLLTIKVTAHQWY